MGLIRHNISSSHLPFITLQCAHGLNWSSHLLLNLVTVRFYFPKLRLLSKLSITGKILIMRMLIQ